MSEPGGSTPRSNARPVAGLLLFALKAIIVVACILYATDWIINDVQYSTVQTVANLRQQFDQQFEKTPIGGRQFWSKIEHELDRAAAPGGDLPAAKKEKLLKDIQIIVARWKPFVDAVNSGLATPTTHPIEH